MIEIQPLPTELPMDDATRAHADALIEAVVERANALGIDRAQLVSAMTAALGRVAHGVDLAGLTGMALAAGMGNILQLETMQLEQIDAGIPLDGGDDGEAG